ncbi:AraC family transcriptional regulator [Shewanella sp. AC91-MNA-CIBAN-0169]|jgi:AraC-like DNA-binding protein
MLFSMTAKLVESTSWHRHDILEWFFCRSGSGRLESEVGTIELHPGRTVLIAPGTSHRLAFQPGEDAELKILCMNSHDLATYISPAQRALLGRMRFSQVRYTDHDKSLSNVRELSDLIRDGAESISARDLALSWGAVGMLLAFDIETDDLADDYVWHRYSQKIQDIRDWIDTQLHESNSLDQVGREFGLSRTVLTREFRRHTGESFINYCNLRRVEVAATILSAGKGSITQVALDSGFTNLSHFYRQFKAVYGMTPAAFRRQSTKQV